MEWLTPISGAIAAAIAVPALVALYFLKLRRRDEPVSSTLLWRRAVQDLQVNAPFRMIRHNILLILQLLALGAALFALARPAMHVAADPGTRYVILIDCSASMNATDVAPTRLDEAKRQAGVLVDSLRDRRTWSFTDQADEAMVIAFDIAPRILCNYTSDKARLHAAIDSIRPTDAPTHLAEAASVGRAFATATTVDTNNRSAEIPARLELFSDGRIADMADVSVGSSDIVYHAIGSSTDNVAVVAMKAARPYDQPDHVEVFASLLNYGSQPVKTDVQLSLSGDVRAVRALEIPAMAEGRPGEASVQFTLDGPSPGVVEVRSLHRDALATDDVAWTMLQPPSRLAVLLVTEGNLPLRSALKACPLGRLEVKTPAEFDALDHDTLELERPWNLIILDNHPAPRMPAGNYLVFGRPPPALGLATSGELKGQFIIDWRSRHPLLNYVNLTSVYAAEAWKLDLPRDADVLAEFEDGPALATLRRHNGLVVLAPFSVLQTNWPFGAGFPMFFVNLTTLLAEDLGENAAATLKVGQPITVVTSLAQKEARFTTPDGREHPATSDTGGRFRFAATDHAGIYKFNLESAPPVLYAVNLLDTEESNIGPADHIEVAGLDVPAQRTEVTLANREIWPFLVAAALLFVLIEWWVYNAKVRI